MSTLNRESSGQPKRFVILRHYFPDGGNGEFPDHFDLMLEQEAKLATWQLEALPKPDESVSAKKLPDHRALYLDYEGPISGDRGSVEQVMAGTYRVCHQDDTCLEVVLAETLHDKSIRLKIVFGASSAATLSRIGSSAPDSF